MAGGVHHIIVNVNDIARSRPFYEWLCPKLGYGAVWTLDDGRSVGFMGPRGSFWIKQADPRFAADTFHKDRVGLCEIAFWAETREQVDEVARELVARGVTLLDPPREYDYVRGYYAVFFPDPDGLKLEIVHLPI